MTDPAAKISVRGYAQDIRARPFVKWAGGNHDWLIVLFYGTLLLLLTLT